MTMQLIQRDGHSRVDPILYLRENLNHKKISVSAKVIATPSAVTTGLTQSAVTVVLQHLHQLLLLTHRQLEPDG
jgi:hypothetical protein